MKIDYQLVAEAETLLPKIEGLGDNCHIVQSHLNWYQHSCDGTDAPCKLTEMYKKFLEESISNAKQILTKQSL